MNSLMKHTVLASGLAWAPLASGAVVIDWLQLVPESSSSGFSLLRDDGTEAAHATPGIETGFPDVPRAFPLQAAAWKLAPSVQDSQSGNATVGAFEFFVAPPPGDTARYTLEFSVSGDAPLYLAIGGLHQGEAGSSAVQISAAGASGASTLSLVEFVSWDNGFASFTEELDWDGSTLAPAAGAVGESGIAVFRIDPLAGEPTTLSLVIPHANGPTFGGDPLILALGIAVPEPSSLGLLALSGWICLRRSRPR